MEHILIIGGGAVGLTSAQALLLAGHKVTLVERGTIGQEASWAGGGIMSPLCSWDYKESVTRLTQRSMAMFESAMQNLHNATGIDPQYQRSGMLILPPNKAGLATAWCRDHQVALKQVVVELPGLQGEGLLMPEIGQVRNPRLLAALRCHVERLGCLILEHHEVQKITLAGERITGIQTSQGLLSADGYLLCAGAWSYTLLGEHALKLDVHPIRGQMLLFKFDTPPIEHILLQESLYLIPRRDGHVLVGSTLEDTGFDKSTTLEARSSLLQKVSRLFPDWPAPIDHWAGLRPGSADNIPTLGRHPDIANLYVNCGHFRYGVTMSLACADLVLGEITGRAQPFSLDEYRWRR